MKYSSLMKHEMLNFAIEYATASDAYSEDLSNHKSLKHIR